MAVVIKMEGRKGVFNGWVYKVCKLCKEYLLDEKVWQKAVGHYAKSLPEQALQVGWWKLLPHLGGETSPDLLVYKHTYWKMTNLNSNWSAQAKAPTEHKRHFHRSGVMVWKFVASGRAFSVYCKGKGFVLKVHDNQAFKFRNSYYNRAGTLAHDNLCLDATESKVVVAGFNSQKVWVFDTEEVDVDSNGILAEFLVKIKKPAPKKLNIKLTKFIASAAGVAKVKIHSDEKRIAVLLPVSQAIEIWNMENVTRLHRHAVASDSSFLVWRKDTLLTAPLYTGIIQVFDTTTHEEKPSLCGAIRRVDAVAVYESLVATGETQMVRLWDMNTCTGLISWEAAKSAVTALYMNDAMLVTGSKAGIVKLWDLGTLLREGAATVSPLRKINMKGLLHYPIKNLYQSTYTDLVIVAKYEGKKKKDKVKVVEVLWN